MLLIGLKKDERIILKDLSGNKIGHIDYVPRKRDGHTQQRIKVVSIEE